MDAGSGDLLDGCGVLIGTGSLCDLGCNRADRKRVMSSLRSVLLPSLSCLAIQGLCVVALSQLTRWAESRPLIDRPVLNSLKTFENHLASSESV